MGFVVIGTFQLMRVAIVIFNEMTSDNCSHHQQQLWPGQNVISISTIWS